MLEIECRTDFLCSEPGLTCIFGPRKSGKTSVCSSYHPSLVLGCVSLPEIKQYEKVINQNYIHPLTQSLDEMIGIIIERSRKFQSIGKQSPFLIVAMELNINLLTTKLWEFVSNCRHDNVHCVCVFPLDNHMTKEEEEHWLALLPGWIAVSDEIFIHSPLAEQWINLFPGLSKYKTLLCYSQHILYYNNNNNNNTQRSHQIFYVKLPIRVQHDENYQKQKELMDKYACRC